MSLTRRRVLTGVLQGGFGVLIMQFGIHIEGGVLIDLRTIPMMIAAYLGGWASAVVATVIIIFCRLALYPISYSALINVVVLTLSAITFSLISHSNMKIERKWSFMAVSFITILGITIPFVIPDFRKAFIIFTQYAFAVICGTYGTYLLKSYLWRNDQDYARLKKFAQKDYLTGLDNIRSFNHAIDSAFLKAKEHQEELSLLYIDIDHFKQVNDTYGHPAGDKVLQKVGHILIQSCRSVDIVSRNGGEEFSIIMPACDSASARTIAERIRQSIEESVFVINKDVELKVTVSIGYTTLNQKNMVSIGQLIHQADEGLYRAKRTGRNRISSNHSLYRRGYQ
ncbi:GGDEF domain-containing protein [Aneurinibacillus tyrosinisolvens]|uniref:GGDEF domain-containing protein n=1 Tax=Aneurinibacillus tyrosinisolvens TaxID=1443435 RepID=UPI0022A8E2D7|nr:diguanylate cyclase [Aneurinibacillus tyrosinisolvens]